MADGERSTDSGPLHGQRPRRLAYLITSSGMGGAEREVCHLARAFKGRGWDVAVISMLPLEPPISELAADGITTASLGMQQGIPDPRAIRALRHLLLRWRPDVLHAHMVHANLLARISRLVTPIPVVVSTIYNENEGAQWRYVAYRLTDRLSDLTTAVSRVAMAEAIRRRAVGARSVVLVPNGIRTDAFAADARARGRTRAALGIGDEFVWLAVGRLVEAKAHGDMVTAFAGVLDEHPDAMLLVAGVGPLADSIGARARHLGVADKVRLLGLRTDVRDLMQAADGFVMSSRWEGLPMVLLEAGASALPTVTTDVGGSRDVIVDGASGYVVPPGRPAALGARMRDVMTLTPDARRAMGAEGRAHVVRTFDIEAVADTWQSLYGRAGGSGSS